MARRARPIRGLAALALAVGLSLSTAAGASALGLVQIGTYAAPLHVTSAPDDPDRIFVAEREGRIKLTTHGQTSTFLDITSLVSIPGEVSDRGLLSVAFAPDFGSTGRFYVLYTGEEGGVRVDEFTASGDSASLATRRPVLEIEHDSLYHYGGQLQFGPDGYLYISTGDNGTFGPGPGGDPDGNAQNIESPHGKILRIDPRPAGGQPYAAPQDNPFVGEPGMDEIWSLGLRNPWRFSFDRATGDLVIGDVGQDVWEDVEYAPRTAGGGRGDNYGWNCREGPDPYSGCTGSFTDPAFSYLHDGDPCSSITGGYVVRDKGLPDLLGRYLYGDFCHGSVRSLRLGLPAASDDRAEPIELPGVTSFGQDACGRLYAAILGGGVYRIVGDNPTDCLEPQLSLRGKLRQRLGARGRVTIGAHSDETSTVTVAASVWVSGAHPAAVDLLPSTLPTAGLQLAPALLEAGAPCERPLPPPVGAGPQGQAPLHRNRHRPLGQHQRSRRARGPPAGKAQARRGLAQLRPGPLDHRVGELRGRRVALEVGGAHSCCGGLHHRLVDGGGRPRRGHVAALAGEAQQGARRRGSSPSGWRRPCPPAPGRFRAGPRPSPPTAPGSRPG